MSTIQLRRGTAAQATTSNPVLAAGEIGVETDTGKFKIGDGTTAWKDLDYAGGGVTVSLDQIPAPEASVGFNLQKLTNLADPENPRDAVNLETADGRYVNQDEVGASDGVASLDAEGQVPLDQLGNADPAGAASDAQAAAEAAAEAASDAAGTASEVQATAATLVNHGSTAGTARPSGWGFVIWVGSVQPTNIQTQDLWIDTTPA